MEGARLDSGLRIVQHWVSHRQVGSRYYLTNLPSSAIIQAGYAKQLGEGSTTNKSGGRQRELEELSQVLAQGAARFLLIYDRRRVGKTTLILHWAQQTGRPVIDWVATRDTPAQVRPGFTQALWTWAYPGSQAMPRFDTWSAVL